MPAFMTKSSKLLRTTLSPVTEEQVSEILIQVARFKSDADKILLKFQPPTFLESPSKTIESLFSRFHSVALEIVRRHEGRNSLIIKDEYDVQDLLRGLLKIYFEDVRDEEYTPSYGGCCSRMDLLLKKEKIVIETKMLRESLSQKKVRNELIIDKAHYRVHQDCKKLYCFVYDPENRIHNPGGFETDLSDIVNDFETKTFVIPRRY
jgi:hypothetical protein